MNGLIPMDNNKVLNEQMEICSRATWDLVFQLLEFMMNDIYPEDFNEHSPNGIIKDYFKNKYKLIIK